MSRLQPTPLAAYPVTRPLGVRWGDVDVYGHVNNVVYLAWFDTAVNGWYVDEGLLVPGRSSRVFLVVETGCQYFREMRFGEAVTCGIRVARLGSSSVTYDLALFGDDGGAGDEKARARGRFVHVQVDADSRKPAPIEGDARAAFERILVEGADG